MVHDEELQPSSQIVADIIPKKLFHNGFWDGPLDGLCEHDGKIYYFDTEDDIWSCNVCNMTDDECEHCGWDRQFVMHWISPFLINHMILRNKIFMFLVYNPWQQNLIRYCGGMFIWYNIFGHPNRNKLTINCPVAKFIEFERNEKAVR